LRKRSAAHPIPPCSADLILEHAFRTPLWVAEMLAGSPQARPGIFLTFAMAKTLTAKTENGPVAVDNRSDSTGGPSRVLSISPRTRPSGQWNEEDYDVLANGEVVGRTFKRGGIRSKAFLRRGLRSRATQEGGEKISGRNRRKR
jgi:hypothetical protein